MKKALSLLTCLIIILCVFCGCSAKDPDGNKAFPVNIGGAEISKQPTHIAVLSPGVFAVLDGVLGLSGSVTAISNYTISAMSRLMPVGTADEPDINAIVGLSCDLVITNSNLPQDDADLLAAQGIPVAVVPAPSTFDGLQEYYRQLACLCLGNVDGYTTSNTAYENMIANLTGVSATVTVKESAVLLLDKNIVATSGTVGDSILSYAGFENAAKDLQTMNVDFAAIKNLNPSVIFCDTLILNSVKSNADLAETTAVKTNCVFGISVLDTELLGSGIFNSTKQMHNYIYGDSSGSSSEIEG